VRARQRPRDHDILNFGRAVEVLEHLRRRMTCERRRRVAVAQGRRVRGQQARRKAGGQDEGREKSDIADYVGFGRL
jgi:hypothetical protein